MIKMSGNLFNKWGVTIDVIFGRTVKISITKVHNITLKEPILLTSGNSTEYAKTTLADIMDNISITNSKHKSTITTRFSNREHKIVIRKDNDILSIVCDKGDVIENINIYHNIDGQYIVIDNIFTFIFNEMNNDYDHKIIKISYSKNGSVKFKTVEI